MPSNGWQPRFLAELEEVGGRWIAARAAGVTRTQVLDELARNPSFGQQVEDALELYADRLEQVLVHPQTKNVVGPIVRLKALRPHLYLEKHITLGLTMHQDKVSHGEAATLLRAMLGDLRPETAAAFALATGVPLVERLPEPPVAEPEEAQDDDVEDTVLLQGEDRPSTP